jgi:flagellar assembly factor FliW
LEPRPGGRDGFAPPTGGGWDKPSEAAGRRQGPNSLESDPRRMPRGKHRRCVTGSEKFAYRGFGPWMRENGEFMDIQTSRFGNLTIEDERIMTFERGLLGFPSQTRFALIQTGQESYFFWLQSVDEPNLAFVVADPSIFFKDYDVPLREETLTDLKITDISFAQVFVICNRVGEWLTGNLLGPIVVNASNRLAQQVVLTEKKWTTRQPLLRLQGEVALAKSA